MNRSRRKTLVLNFLLFLFALNSISLCFYFSSHSHLFFHQKPNIHNHSFPSNSLKNPFLPNPFYSHGKPWPILPSYLPWTLNPNTPPHTCEAYFGNGFTRRIDVLESHKRSADGWFRCFYSETLESSICEGGRILMNPHKIKMSLGGEKLETVIGREEEDELPEFDPGAFQIEVSDGVVKRRKGNKLVDQEFLDRYVPAGQIRRHTMRGLLDSVQLVGTHEFNCSQWVEEPILLLTRFEYANLFHTVTDWYSAYIASRVTGLPNRPHLVFVDGHCKTPLEETWEALFSSVRYAKNFSGSVCFRHAILSPLGYETVLFKGLTEAVNCQGAVAHDLWENPDDGKTARLSEFGEMIRAAFGFPVDRTRVPKPVSVHNILFVRREDYLAHPRHAGKVQSRLSNEQEVFDALKDWVTGNLTCKVNFVNGLFAHMPMKEQIRAIQDASVIIGAHGAGLTHIVSAMPKTVVLEIISSNFLRPHFAYISQWKGLEYHAINLRSSYAEINVVIEKLSSIMKNLGC